MITSETMLATIITAIFASTGFWSLISYFVQRKDAKKDKTEQEISVQSEMLLGIGHDRIVYLGTNYIERGYITQAEYENLHDYLFIPYKKLGGNGTAEKVMKEVEELSIGKRTGSVKK